MRRVFNALVSFTAVVFRANNQVNAASAAVPNDFIDFNQASALCISDPNSLTDFLADDLTKTKDVFAEAKYHIVEDSVDALDAVNLILHQPTYANIELLWIEQSDLPYLIGAIDKHYQQLDKMALVRFFNRYMYVPAIRQFINDHEDFLNYCADNGDNAEVSLLIKMAVDATWQRILLTQVSLIGMTMLAFVYAMLHGCYKEQVHKNLEATLQLKKLELIRRLRELEDKLKEKNQEIEQQTKSHSDQVKALTDTNKQKLLELKQAKSQLLSLQLKIDASPEKIDQLKEEKLVLEKSIKQLERALKQKQSDLKGYARLTKKVADQENTIKDLNDEISKMVANKNKKSSKKNDQFKTLQQKFKKIVTQCESLRHAVQQAQQQNRKLIVNSEKFEEIEQGYLKQIKDQQSVIANLTNAVKHLKDQESFYQQQNATLQAAIGQLKSQITTLENKIKESSAILIQRQQRHGYTESLLKQQYSTELQQNKNEAAAEIKKLTEQLDQQKSDLETLKSKLEASEKQVAIVAHLQQQLTQAQAVNQSLLEELQKLNTLLTAADDVKEGKAKTADSEASIAKRKPVEKIIFVTTKPLPNSFKEYILEGEKQVSSDLLNIKNILHDLFKDTKLIDIDVTLKVKPLPVYDYDIRITAPISDELLKQLKAALLKIDPNARISYNKEKQYISMNANMEGMPPLDIAISPNPSDVPIIDVSTQYKFMINAKVKAKQADEFISALLYHPFLLNRLLENPILTTGNLTNFIKVLLHYVHAALYPSIRSGEVSEAHLLQTFKDQCRLLFRDNEKILLDNSLYKNPSVSITTSENLHHFTDLLLTSFTPVIINRIGARENSPFKALYSYLMGHRTLLNKIVENLSAQMSLCMPQRLFSQPQTMPPGNINNGYSTRVWEGHRRQLPSSKYDANSIAQLPSTGENIKKSNC